MNILYSTQATKNAHINNEKEELNPSNTEEEKENMKERDNIGDNLKLLHENLRAKKANPIPNYVLNLQVTVSLDEEDEDNNKPKSKVRVLNFGEISQIEDLANVSLIIFSIVLDPR